MLLLICTPQVFLSHFCSLSGRFYEAIFGKPYNKKTYNVSNTRLTGLESQTLHNHHPNKKEWKK